MSSEVAIKVSNVSKHYHIYDKPLDRLKQSLYRGKRQFYTEFKAIDNVSFEIKEGETVGIVGRNGAGKSTLLQMICGTLTPSFGDIQINGRVAALLELGAGFNPEFTGSENVYMNAALLGLTKKEIDERYEEILEFADIGEFIHHPVKTYSSGMYVRLAFSVAVCVEPDVFVIDEALAVGDTNFQLKCIDRLNKLKDQGTTILFVSHSTDQIKRFCDKCIWIDEGKITDIGAAAKICDKYVERELQNNLSNASDLHELASVKNDSDIEGGISICRIKNIKLNKDLFSEFESFSVDVEYTICVQKIESFLIGVAIFRRRDSLYVFGPNTYLDKVFAPNTKGTHMLRFSIPKLPFMGGGYKVEVGAFGEKGLVCIDYKADACEFEVQASYVCEGLVSIDHGWEVLRSSRS